MNYPFLARTGLALPGCPTYQDRAAFRAANPNRPEPPAFNSALPPILYVPPSGTFLVLDLNTAGQPGGGFRTVGPFTGPNFPDDSAEFKPWVNPGTTDATVQPEAMPAQPVPTQYLCTLSELQALETSLLSSGAEIGPSNTLPIQGAYNWGSEQRRIFALKVNGHDYYAAQLYALMSARGVGAPGSWTVSPDGASVSWNPNSAGGNQQPLGVPVRALAAGEALKLMPISGGPIEDWYVVEESAQPTPQQFLASIRDQINTYLAGQS